MSAQDEVTIKAGIVRNRLKALGWPTRADEYSRAKGRGHVKVTQMGPHQVAVSVAMAEVTLPSELDDRRTDILSAAQIAQELTDAGYSVKINSESKWRLEVTKPKQTGIEDTAPTAGDMRSSEAMTAHEVVITFALPALRPDLLEAMRHYVENGRLLKDAVVDGGGTASITVDGTPIEER